MQASVDDVIRSANHTLDELQNSSIVINVSLSVTYIPTSVITPNVHTLSHLGN